MTAFQQLQKEISGFGHAEYPFLDSQYSPGSCAPVIDFTLWLRDRISVDDMQSVGLLLQQITNRPEVVEGLFKTLRFFNLRGYIVAEDALVNELTAIYILAYRTRFHVSGHGHTFLLATLVEMVLSLYPFQLRPEKLGELTRKLRDAKRKDEILTLPTDGPTANDANLTKEILQKLRHLPPTCRFVLHDAIRKAETVSTPIHLRLSAYYDLRMYGCNDRWNAHYISWLGWSSPITADTDISRFVDKPAIQAALDASGVSYKKSAKKTDLLDSARANPQCWNSLCATFSHEVVVFQPHIFAELQRWSLSVSALRWTSYAMAAI